MVERHTESAEFSRDSVTFETQVKRRSGKGRLICLAGLILATMALSTQWLSLRFIEFDIFSHFTLHYVLAALACLVGFFMPRWRVLTAGSIIFAGIAAISLWPHTDYDVSGDAVPLAKDERRLKVMTFNTWLRNRDWRAVVKEVHRTKPDVVTLIEFGKEKRRALTELKKDYPYTAHCMTVPYCHIAILSKYPLSDIKSRGIWIGPTYIRARLGPRFGRTYIYAIHSTRPPYWRLQIDQLLKMGKYLDRLPGQKIVMGDFNATPYSELLRRFASRAKLRRVTFLPTYPVQFAPVAQLAIDHVFVSDGVRRLSPAVIGDRSGSDHYPTVMDVAVKVAP